MREHPIPQDVTGYRFHIIGNMTLKQFLEVAAGVVVAIILYNTNLAPVIKWPLMFLSAGFGALVAWVPFEERPLDHWLTVFISVLYHPTKFFWRKHPQIPAPFLFKPRQDQVNAPEVVDLTPARKARIQEYLTSVKATQPKEAWETEEASQISNILAAFDTVEVDHVSATQVIQKPDLDVRVRSLHAVEEVAPVEVAAPLPIAAPTLTPVVETIEPSISVAVEAPIPESSTQAIAPPPEIPAATTFTAPAPLSAPPSTAVTTNAHLPFPNQPTTPNKLVGMVLDAEGKIVSNAIVEIKNLQGLVARAVKTNALGQFFVTTPLENGTYSVAVDKAGFSFEIQRLNLTGEIVPPLQITAS